MQQNLIDGRYALGSLLGGGGMAQVYLAHDEVLGRDVALKILREQYTDEEFVERFRREAKNAAALNHPNIVQIYDQGQTEDGTYYIAMEYVPGETLKSRINSEGRLDPGEAAGIASRVADALSVAHERGIVHRDIKPQNVLLTPSGEAKVADFGIARAASSKTVTETNLVLGTAAYMSPEQVSGERAGPASDLYSLGVVLYEMLTGELPYQAEDPIATAMKHLDEPPRHPREANPAVPEALDALTTKLLAKKPEDRYPGAAELTEDLRRVRDGLSPLAVERGEQATTRLPQDAEQTRTAPTVLAPGPSAPASSRRRSALLTLLALLLGAVLLGGLAWALSRGSAEQVEVPRVVGLSTDEAQQRLEGAGLELGSQTEAQSEEVAAGVVIEQDPAQGTEVDRGTGVDVAVSTGPPLDPAVQTSSPSASPTASPAASPTASPTASPSAAPRGDEEAAEEARKAAEVAQKKAEERREEAAVEREKRLEEAQKKAEVRQKEPEGKAKVRKK
jgi:tRNA A-37 threonylcarbamoyl transferase component Bud32